MRPEIKVGDRVRFRTDGEIGEILKLWNYDDHYHEVVSVHENLCELYDLQAIHDIEYSNIEVQPIFLEICNDFSEIEVGDEVEVIDLPHGNVRQFFVSDIVYGIIVAGYVFEKDGYAYIDDEACSKLLRIVKAGEK
jgi:hypothetical protein